MAQENVWAGQSLTRLKVYCNFLQVKGLDTDVEALDFFAAALDPARGTRGPGGPSRPRARPTKAGTCGSVGAAGTGCRAGASQVEGDHIGYSSRIVKRRLHG